MFFTAQKHPTGPRHGHVNQQSTVEPPTIETEIGGKEECVQIAAVTNIPKTCDRFSNFYSIHTHNQTTTSFNELS